LFSVSAVSSFDSSLFFGIANSLKNAFLTILGILTTLISATVSLQNLIASYADSGVIRTAKYALSSMIPIVGNTVSGAFSVLAGSVSYAKGIVGGGAIAAIIFVAISPLVSLLMYRLCFSVAIFLSNLCSGEQGGVLSSLASALDALIAVYTLTAVVYIIQITIFLKGGASFV
jgi:stage III sporulation protein AE